jgi:hypothetical protein
MSGLVPTPLYCHSRDWRFCPTLAHPATHKGATHSTILSEREVKVVGDSQPHSTIVGCIVIRGADDDPPVHKAQDAPHPLPRLQN